MTARALSFLLTCGLLAVGPQPTEAQEIVGRYDVTTAPMEGQTLRPAKEPQSLFTQLAVAGRGGEVHMEFGRDDESLLVFDGSVDRGGEISAARTLPKAEADDREVLVARVSRDGTEIEGRFAFFDEREELQILRFEATRRAKEPGSFDLSRFAVERPEPEPVEPACSTCYVNPIGSDDKGDGSETNPWETVQHALVTMDLSTDDATLHLAPGRYRGPVEIYPAQFPDDGQRRSLTLAGAGVDDVVLAPNPDTTQTFVLRATGDFDLVIHDLTLESPDLIHGLQVDGVSLDLHDARFVKLAPFAIHISNSPDFAIRRTEVRSWDNTFTAWQTDNGVSVHDSHGLIEDFYGGPNIDHIIDVVNSDLVVRRADLEGSSIGYADGIRSINTRLTVEDCEIHRALFPPRSSASQHLSDGGIEIIFSLEQPETYQVRIEGNTIRGWRDGLYIYADQHDFLVQNNDFESNGNPVYSTDREHAIRLEPCGGPGCPGANTVVIDLGGGALGGGGGNAFGEDERFTVHNTMTVDVPAYHNDWGVTDPVEIELRIHDGEDDPQVGRVLYQLNSGM